MSGLEAGWQGHLVAGKVRGGWGAGACSVPNRPEGTIAAGCCDEPPSQICTAMAGDRGGGGSRNRVFDSLGGQRSATPLYAALEALRRSGAPEAEKDLPGRYRIQEGLCWAMRSFASLSGLVTTMRSRRRSAVDNPALGLRGTSLSPPSRHLHPPDHNLEQLHRSFPCRSSVSRSSSE